MEDLNYLFYRQQQERSLAAAATCDAARAAHEELAVLYESEIKRMSESRIDIPPPASMA